MLGSILSSARCSHAMEPLEGASRGGVAALTMNDPEAVLLQSHLSEGRHAVHAAQMDLCSIERNKEHSMRACPQ